MSRFEQEVQFEASRASGPGGQHVQKTSTRISLRFNIGQSRVLNEEEKQRVREKLAGRINKADELIIHVETHRSQHRNKKTALSLLEQLIEHALHKPKARHKTKPTRAAVRRRLDTKSRTKQKKELRRKVGFE